jgi:hypothetical protein
MTQQWYYAKDGTKWTSQKDADSHNTVAPGADYSAQSLGSQSRNDPLNQRAPKSTATGAAGVGSVGLSTKVPTVTKPGLPTAQRTSSSMWQDAQNASGATFNQSGTNTASDGQPFDFNGIAYGDPDFYLLPPELQRQRAAYALGLDDAETNRIMGMTPLEFQKWLIEKEKEKMRVSKEATELEKQIQDSQLAEFRKNTRSSVNAVEAAFAQSPEGPMSSTAGQARQNFTNAATVRLDNADKQYRAAKMRVEQTQKAMEDAQRLGNIDRAAGLAESLAEAQNQLVQSQAQMAQLEESTRQESLEWLSALESSGALSGMQQSEIEQLVPYLQSLPDSVSRSLLNGIRKQNMSSNIAAQADAMKKGIDTLFAQVKDGFNPTMGYLQQYSEMTGIPLEVLVDFTESSANIINDKALDPLKKEQELNKLLLEVDRSARGITNDSLEKLDYLTNLYRSGASQEEIALAKKMMGIKDEDDPMYVLDYNVKSLQYKIAQDKANGLPVNLEDKIMLEKYLREQQVLTGATGGAYLPNSPADGLTVTYENGELSVGNVRSSYQCGAFVNRTWGLSSSSGGGFGDSYDSKTSIVDERGVRSEDLVSMDRVKPGMAFVMPVGGRYSKVGHVGLVKSVNSDGTFNTLEANANGDGQVSSRVLSIDQVYGFAPPPEGKYSSSGDYYEQMASGLDRKIDLEYKNFKKGLVTKTAFIDKVIADVPKEMKEYAREYVSEIINSTYNVDMGEIPGVDNLYGMFGKDAPSYEYSPYVFTENKGGVDSSIYPE